MTEYTALLALPDGDTARDAASRLDWAETVTVTDDTDAGVWLTWTVSADNDQEGIALIQEIRLRAEMHLDHHPHYHDKKHMFFHIVLYHGLNLYQGF